MGRSPLGGPGSSPQKISKLKPSEIGFLRPRQCVMMSHIFRGFNQTTPTLLDLPQVISPAEKEFYSHKKRLG